MQAQAALVGPEAAVELHAVLAAGYDVRYRVVTQGTERPRAPALCD